MKVRFFFLALSALMLTSCAGYRFNDSNNPLLGYEIRSIAVPMFVNHSVIPGLSAPLTREITFVLNDYSGLKVVSGDNAEADAVLIGVVESANHYNEVVRTTQELFTDDTASIKSSIGKRSSFYFPVSSSYQFSLRVILIKRPSQEDIELLTSDVVGESIKAHPKVVLTDRINITGSFTRVVGESTSSNAAGKVNFVKNKGIFEKSLQEVAVSAAQTFKQVVLNAF